MIVLLGGSGFVGSAFRDHFDDVGQAYLAPRRIEIDYTSQKVLRSFLETVRPHFLINAAGYTGKPNVDACEKDKARCLQGNAVLPGIIREVCESLSIPWGHVSSGCIFTGSKEDGGGFRETDAPNFCFRTNNCSFYSGTKALGEECLEGCGNVYIWRLRIPFNHIDSSRNYLSKLQRYENLLDARNSITHLNEFASVCHQSWTRRIPFGTYNITNTGSITTREVVGLIREKLRLNKNFRFFVSEQEFMQEAAKTPRSNCVMENSKILATGICMRSVEQAIVDSLDSWTVQKS
jgi:dTDP-4-dehydrorhamnose reductase